MIKSQDDLNKCNDGKRSSDVLIHTIEKCEKLQKQLDIAVKCLKQYAKGTNWKDYEENDVVYFDALFRPQGYKLADKTLKQIKELDK